MSDPTLRSKKAVFIRPSLSCQPFQWLGNGSYAGGTKTMSSRMLTQVTRNPYMRGVFGVNVSGAGSQTSNGTTVPLTMKESVCDYLYGLKGFSWDIDIRTQLCSGMVDDPFNWNMIKRVCYASVLDEGVDQESTYSPDGEGEVMHTVNMASSYDTCMIYPVESREYDLTDLYNLSNNFYLGYNDVWPHIDVRYGNEWVISIGDASYYGVVWGKDIGNLTIGRLNMTSPIAYLSVKDRIVVVSDTNGDVWISHDNGDNFILQHDSATLGVGAFRAVLVESFASVWLTTDDSRVYVSFDGGKTLSQRISLYSVPNYEITDITKSNPDNVLFFADMVGFGISQTDEDVIQRVIESATDYTSLPPNIVHADGILFIGGKDDQDQPVLKMSLNDGHDWMYSLQLTGMSVLSDDYIVVMPASAGCGVIWLAVLYQDSESDIHCDVYRSVYYGLPGTWKLEWSQEVGLGGQTAFGLFPTDIAAVSTNHCTVVGLWLDWLDPVSLPHLYAVELFSCED